MVAGKGAGELVRLNAITNLAPGGTSLKVTVGVACVAVPLRGLLLVLQRDTDQPLRVVNLQAQRMRGRGVRISFGLTAPAQVKAVIMTLTGRIVRVLDGGSRMAGTHQLFWQGDTEGGNPAPVGVYLLRLQATDEQGRQVQAARTVMWR